MARPTWRGVTVCTCMTPPLAELARISGNDIRVTPIRGFGSYQSGTTASGATATGGGHVDINLEGYSQEQRLRLERLARSIGWYADIRYPRWWSRYFGKWLTARWQHHLHMLLKECPHLSGAAEDQIREWIAGQNGLVGGNLNDGPRPDEFLLMTWWKYKAAQGGPTPAVTTITSLGAGLSLTGRIVVAQVRKGKNNTEIRRYQAALWNHHTVNYRRALLERHRLRQNQIADGDYGKVTAEMTEELYELLDRRYPTGGWTPDADEPGPGLMRYLGFSPA